MGGNTRSDRGVTHIVHLRGCEKRENERKKENRPGVDEALLRTGCLRIKIRFFFFFLVIFSVVFKNKIVLLFFLSLLGIFC